MRFKANFFRLFAIPACVVWGVMEFVCLQRSRWVMRRDTWQTPQS